jgi:hypothetical protein
MIWIVLFYSNIIIYLLLVINSSCYLYYVKDTNLIPTYNPNTFSDDVRRKWKEEVLMHQRRDWLNPMTKMAMTHL